MTDARARRSQTPASSRRQSKRAPPHRARSPSRSRSALLVVLFFVVTIVKLGGMSSTSGPLMTHAPDRKRADAG